MGRGPFLNRSGSGSGGGGGGTVTDVTASNGLVSSGGDTPNITPDFTGADDGDVFVFDGGTASFQSPAAVFGEVDPIPDTLLLRDGDGSGYVNIIYTSRVQSNDSDDGLSFVVPATGLYQWRDDNGIARYELANPTGVNAFVWTPLVSAVGWSFEDRVTGVGATASFAGQNSPDAAGGAISWIAGNGTVGGAATWRAGAGAVTGGQVIIRGGAGGTTNGRVQLQNSAGATLIDVATATGETTINCNLIPGSANNYNIGSAARRFSTIETRQFIARADNTDTLKTAFSGTGLSVTNGVNPGSFTATYLDWQELGNWRLNYVSDSDASGLTFDLDAGNIHTVQLTGDRTIAFTNLRAGGKYTFSFEQGGSGGYAVEWPAGTVLPNGFPIILSRTVGSIDTISGHSDGTNFFVESVNIQDGTIYQGVAQLAGTITYAARGCDYVPFNPSGSLVSVTLPLASTISRNQPITVKNRTASTDPMVISADGGGDTIDGAATYTSDQPYQLTTFVSNEVDGWDVG